MKDRIDALREKPRLRLAMMVLAVAAMTGMQWLQLDLSSGIQLMTLLDRKLEYQLVNLAMVFAVDMLFVTLTRRWRWGYFLGNILFFVWSVAGHYTRLFSGDVLTLTALLSAGTAMDVLSGYRLALDMTVAASAAVFAVNMVLAWLAGRLYRGPIPWRRVWIPALAMVILGGGAVGSLGPLEKRDSTAPWRTRIEIGQYGYPVYFVRQGIQSIRCIQKPAGYDADTLEAIKTEYADKGTAGSADQKPDIILILNESFYDLDHYTDTDTDAPYLEKYRGVENALRGYAVVPSIGGGTNRTEYELLTGNSMLLVSCQAPFNVVDLTDANSAVTYLESLGYTTWAMHQASGANYNRGRGYADMGFDERKFVDDFTFVKYGERMETDMANYGNLEEWYASAGEGPRFMYLLTYQNHGGYEQNEASFDTVHTGRDFGDLTDDVDEYLTSISMSDGALGRLLTDLDREERPVLVCMVGDHAPSFLTQLPAREGMTAEEREVIARSTPFIIWANKAFGPLPETDGLQVSTPDLFPMMLRLAGLPLSPYYQAILDLQEAAPVRLSTGQYLTAAGETGYFAQDDPGYDTLAPYYYLEYENLKSASDRRQELFDPPAG